ncbi:MAG: M20/M25/M40 family metallo-hydrolase [Gemmatimonadaceae bacterium]
MRILISVLCIIAGPLGAQAAPARPAPPRPPPLTEQGAVLLFDSASVAWDAGYYNTALLRLDRLLSAPMGLRHLEPAALLTGELYRTTEVTPDGAAPQWSADGRLAAYATGGGRIAHIVAVEGDTTRLVARLDGVGLAMSPDGVHAAYFAIRESPVLRAARVTADSLQRAGEFRRLAQQRQTITQMERELARVILRVIATGQERELEVPAVAKTALTFAPDGRTLYFVGSARGDTARSDIFAIEDVTGAAGVVTVTDEPGLKSGLLATARGYLVYMIGDGTVAVRGLATRETRTFEGRTPAVAADGSLVVWLSRNPMEYTINALSLTLPGPPAVLKRSPQPLASPAPSPDGQRVAYAAQPRDDWEIYVIGANGQADTRLTREIQHDRFPQWLSADRLVAIKGEARHSRAYLYEVSTGTVQRVHHNNTVRTVAPEYAWAASPDGQKLLIVSDREGDTISPERGVYLVHFDRPISQVDLLARVRAMRAVERDLRARGERMFAAIAVAVRAAVRDVSVARIYGYERALFEFDSKFITQPGNRMAIDYIAAQLRAWGYEPELQWFEPRPGVRTANVIATLRGTTNPGLVYVVSSHFDSVERGPGADDNTSGTAALLEAARVLARRPQAATIQFAWFTGEEGGLLGSREYVRRAVAANQRIVGALNNDMIGWSNDFRLDNTIRYSNDGIRDLQHAAAFGFTNLITYDARYYRSTDAHAYYEAYGDIVGGIGSYPILGNPHYHQSHDILETINHPLVAEVSKTTVASLMLLASSPSRVDDLVVNEVPGGGGARARWTRSPERGITRYVVKYGPPDAPERRTVTVAAPQVVLRGVGAGWHVSVRAVNGRAMESWDAARARVRAEPTPSGTFWNALQDLCGKSFLGTITESIPPDTVFAGRTMQMHVRECAPNEIRIPFYVGADRSRTWVVTRTAAGLRLKHDHRHEDGTPDRVTQYGGDTRGAGSAVFQDFFADSHTASLLPASRTNIWTIELVPGERFVYALRRTGSDRRFRVTFNLRQVVSPPPPPWGTKGATP